MRARICGQKEFKIHSFDVAGNIDCKQPDGVNCAEDARSGFPGGVAPAASFGQEESRRIGIITNKILFLAAIVFFCSYALA